MFYYLPSGYPTYLNTYPSYSSEMNLFFLGLDPNKIQIPQNSKTLQTNYSNEEIFKAYANYISQQNIASDYNFCQNHQIQNQEENNVERNRQEKKEQAERAKVRSNSDTFESTSKQSYQERCKEDKELSPKKKKSQTKNLIKNYGRAILTFMIKHKQLRLKVLAHLKINDQQFIEEVQNYRNHIHTISAIRYLWQHHPFSQAFRILSCEYLRKHNLEHIFNSRVFKHSVYLKYQQKLMKSMQRPQEFQSIKQD